MGGKRVFTVAGRKMTAISRARDEMAQSFIVEDLADILRPIVRSAREVLHAESCGIFLMHKDGDRELVRKANSSDKAKDDDLQVALEKGSLTFELAFKQGIVNWNHEKLKKYKLATGPARAHLISGRYFSILAAPLKDRKGRLLGILKADNKKDLNGQPNESVSFHDEDVAIAAALAATIVPLLENSHRSSVLRELMQSILTATDLRTILMAILQKSAALLDANRGDFAWWDPVRQDLILGAQLGSRFSILKEGQPLPTPSIVRSVFGSRRPRLLSNVLDKSVTDYFQTDPRSRCEVAVPVMLSDKVIGVLNMESGREDHFSDQDVSVLQQLARYATIATRIVGRHAHLQWLFHSFVEARPELVQTILKGVESTYDFECGIVFLAKEQTLECLATIGCENNPDLRKFSYKFGSKALATKVFKTQQPEFRPDARKAKDVAQRGVKAFDIRHSLLVMPLVFQGRSVGVLSVWSRRKQYAPKAHHQELLKPFADMAAATIAISESERHRSVILQRIQKIINEMRDEASLANSLRSVLEGVQAAGFDRVRAFEFNHATKTFVGLYSIGKNQEKLPGYRMTVESSPYARYVSQMPATESAAFVFDPTGKAKTAVNLGPGVHWRNLGKPPNLPWAVAPLFVGGVLHGYLAADNAVSKRAITDDSVNYMTMIGTLAAQSIATAQSMDLERKSAMKDRLVREKHPDLFLSLRERIDDFDAFASYNSVDKRRVSRIRDRLRKRGILLWFDRLHLEGGEDWERALEEQIKKAKSAVVFLGENIGPWQDFEFRLLLQEHAEKKLRIIPAVLPEAGTPEIPPFLRRFNIVDFRDDEMNPYDQLIAAIRGTK